MNKPTDHQFDEQEAEEFLRHTKLMNNDDDPGLENSDLAVDSIPSKESQPAKMTALELRQGYRFRQMLNRYDFRQVSGSLVVRDRMTMDGYRGISEDGVCALVYQEDMAPEALPGDARALYAKIHTLAPEFTSLQTIRLGSQVWDTTDAILHELDLSPDSTSAYAPQHVLWYSPHTPSLDKNKQVESYLLSLANKNEAVVEDIVSSIAVTFLSPKPRGVFWWVGSGQNGKSVLMELLKDYIFPNQVSGVGMVQLESGRGVGDFNGALMNISTEALGSATAIDDATNYKSLGAHEPFRVKQLWKDTYLEVRGDINCIYAVNAFPDFKEKNEAITSRTKIIEFTNYFEDQSNFKEDTFTPEFIAAFLGRVIKKAREIYESGGVLSWSETSLASMEDFSLESNPARVFLDQAEFVGFKAINDAYDRYLEWHRNQGIRSDFMSRSEFSTAVGASRFQKRSLSQDRSCRPYFLKHITQDQMKSLMSPNLSNVYYQQAHEAAPVQTAIDIPLQEEESDDRHNW